MKLSTELLEYKNSSQKTVIAITDLLTRWASRAEWLEDRLEGEGMWADIEKHNEQHKIL